MATKTYCFVFLILVLSHVNSNQLVATIHKECNDDKENECLFGAIISFNANDDPINHPTQPTQTIILNHSNYICIKQEHSALLKFNKPMKKGSEPLLFFSEDSQEYTSFKLDDSVHDLNLNFGDPACFVYGYWFKYDERKENNYKIYVNLLSKSALINKDNFYIFEFNLFLDKSNFNVYKVNTGDLGIFPPIVQRKKRLITIFCDKYKDLNPFYFYINNHKFIKEYSGKFEMAFFFDKEIEHNEKEDNKLFEEEIDKNCTPNAYKNMILEYFENKNWYARLETSGFII